MSEDLHAILIDTEGLNSCERGDQSIDMKIFSLGVLLSSYFMYNCIGSIDENVLESLSLVCNLSKHIHVSSKPSTLSEDSTLYSKYFPFFMWVIRDFSLQLVDEEDNDINARQYLENALRPIKSSMHEQENPSQDDEEVHKKNRVRKALSNCFTSRDCHVLVRPVNDERKLREVDLLPPEALR